MADGGALSWRSETKLYSAWFAGASFTPRHILWWTEAAQHAQILWEILVFSYFTLNPHRYIFIENCSWCRLSFCVPVHWCIKAVGGRKNIWGFVCNSTDIAEVLGLPLANQVQSTGIVHLVPFQWTNWFMCTRSDLIGMLSKSFCAECVCQFELDEILSGERCLMSDVHMSHCLPLCQIMLVWAGAN